jgi:acetylornithine aminotransferase
MEARRLLAAAVEDCRQSLDGPRPADPDRRVAYDELLARFGSLRGGPLYYPLLGSGAGHGPLVELADGSVKYDMISGIGVHHLGHGHPLLLDAGIDAALCDTVMQGNLQQHAASVDLAQALVDQACRGGARLRHCFLTSSGAMANENALKLCLHKRSPASRILAFEHAFAGRTLALSQITDKAAGRAGLPTVINVDYVPFFDPARPAESTAEAARTLKKHLSRFPGQHAAMVLELVQGEGGYNVGDAGFFRNLISVLKKHQVPVFVDEVQTFGRTTRPLAFQHFGLDADVDVVSVGKMTQACATLFADDFAPPPGLVSQTFTAATAAILAAIRIIRHLDDAGCFGEQGRNAAVHARFARNLAAVGDRHPGWISGPYGLGGMVAFTPLDGQAGTVKRFLAELFDRGVIAFAAGAEPTRARFLPPVPVITAEQIDAVCSIVEAALTAVDHAGSKANP